MNASFLTYGALNRNDNAMLIYIGSAILSIIVLIIETVLGIGEGFLVFKNRKNISKIKKKACEEFQGTNNYQDCLKTGDYV